MWLGIHLDCGGKAVYTFSTSMWMLSSMDFWLVVLLLLMLASQAYLQTLTSCFCHKLCSSKSELFSLWQFSEFVSVLLAHCLLQIIELLWNIPCMCMSEYVSVYVELQLCVWKLQLTHFSWCDITHLTGWVYYWDGPIWLFKPRYLTDTQALI